MTKAKMPKTIKVKDVVNLLGNANLEVLDWRKPDVSSSELDEGLMNFTVMFKEVLPLLGTPVNLVKRLVRRGSGRVVFLVKDLFIGIKEAHEVPLITKIVGEEELDVALVLSMGPRPIKGKVPITEEKIKTLLERGPAYPLEALGNIYYSEDSRKEVVHMTYKGNNFLIKEEVGYKEYYSNNKLNRVTVLTSIERTRDHTLVFLLEGDISPTDGKLVNTSVSLELTYIVGKIRVLS